METITAKLASCRYEIATSTIHRWFTQGKIKLAGKQQTTGIKSSNLYYTKEIEKIIHTEQTKLKPLVITVTYLSLESYDLVNRIAVKRKRSLADMLQLAISSEFSAISQLSKQISLFASISKRKGIQIDHELVRKLKKKLKELNLHRTYRERITLIGLLEVLVKNYYSKSFS